MAMEAAAYLVWLVPVLLGFCGALLVLYLRDRKANRQGHKDLYRIVSETSANVLLLLERTGGSAPKDSGQRTGTARMLRSGGG